MKAFRIGRKPAGPWTNRTPPIRGGIFHARAQSNTTPDDSDVEAEKEKESVDEGYGSAASHRSGTGSPEPEFVSGRLASSASSDEQGTALRARIGFSASDDSSVHGDKIDVAGSATEVPQLALNPEQWTEWAIQQGKNVDFREYPSIDTTVQQEIASKYRQLHKRVQDAGLYQCPYIEYGKEMARYTTLFAGFIVALRAEWYMTSAICLGLFWVRKSRIALPLLLVLLPSVSICDTLVAVRFSSTDKRPKYDSTKSCSRPMMLDIEPSPPISPLTR